jgi:hypothetical protein
MPETENHDIPYPDTGDDAKVPADMQALAEQVDSELDDIAPSQIQNQTAGKLLIANSSGVITGTAMSGDVTISDAGVTEIGAGKVGATELGTKAVETAKINDSAVTEGKTADGAITSRKAKLTAGVVAASGDLTLTTSYQDVPGAALEITPAVASILEVTVVFDLEIVLPGTDIAAAGEAGYLAEALGSLKVDSDAEQARIVRLSRKIVSAAVGLDATRLTLSEVYALPLTAAAHTIKARAKKSANGSGKCFGSGTAFLYELVAS